MSILEVADARVVVLLTRAPSFGGKTRLFSALGIPPDPALLRALLLDTFDGLLAPDVKRVVAVEPADAIDQVRAQLPPGTDVIAQPDGALGERMQRVMRELLAAGARAVALVGSDLPEFEPLLLARTFGLLERDPDSVVIGPALDGGYYLIAATHAPAIFDGIPWGGPQVLRATLDEAARRQIRVHLLPAISDVDTPDDLTRLLRPLESTKARRTRRWVRRRGPISGGISE